MRIHRYVPMCALAALGGCAVPVSASRDLAAAWASIGAARSAGAREDLAASLYLSLAESELSASRVRFGLGDEAGARGLANRARVDAEVAALFMYERSARDAVHRTMDEAEFLSTRLGARPLDVVPQPLPDAASAAPSGAAGQPEASP